MASQTKPASRWGSFLQQAVAGVESRLDTILADEENTSLTESKSQVPPVQQTKVSTEDSDTHLSASDSVDTGELSRQASRSRKNDRLQERLAKAVVSRNASQTGKSPTRSLISEPVSNTQSTARSSLEAPGEDVSFDSEPKGSANKEQDEGAENIAGNGDSHPPSTSLSLGALPTTSATDTIALKPLGRDDPAESSEDLHTTDARNEYRKEEDDQQQAEYIESLQAKLSFLTTELLHRAQTERNDGTITRAADEYAQKDERIALLLQEGQKLSQNELRLTNGLKKLRIKAADDDARLRQLKVTSEKLDATNKTLATSVKQLEVYRADNERRTALMEKEIERLKVDNQEKSSNLRSLKKQLTESNISKDTITSDELRRDLENERDTLANLREEISTLQVEKKLGVDRHRSQTQELQDQLNAERERMKANDIELRAEIRVLEGRLETYRARAEETSSTAGSNVQTKLYRQIETLQNQYSVASENWRGIESTLLTRITNLEKDREDLARKEADLRRKVREANNRYRRVEEDVEQDKNALHNQKVQLEQQSIQIATLEESYGIVERANQAANDDLKSAQAEVRSLREQAESREMPIHEGSMNYSRTQSPLLSNGKQQTDRPGNEKVLGASRKPYSSPGLGLGGLGNVLERPSSRRASSQNPLVMGRHDSSASLQLGSRRSSIQSPSQTPSIQAEQHDDLFDGVITPATPDRTVNDMFSASTAAAGPSVQLVERMSAAVRRLESEKAASKDEMERLHSQRNEAREQVIALMKEADDRKSADARIRSLEADIDSISKRYQTTLEMLGEKSERVEELQADIADMKQIYKDVLEKTLE